jgi:hypothetical protein
MRIFSGVLVAALGLTNPAPAAPSPDPSAEQTVAFGAWVDLLKDLLDSTPAPAIEAEFASFTSRYALRDDDANLKRDFRRLRLLFEATRDGGFWHLRWDITNQYPSSRRIWEKWIQRPVATRFDEASATAECDELSALLGMLARRLGIRNVGLFYPTWNHTIGAWAPLEGKKKTPLVQLPTSQIFLDCAAGFDQTSFRTQLKNIQPYPSWDVRDTTRLPQARSEWLLEQVRVYAAASPSLWSLMRAKRAFALGSSMGNCNQARARWAKEVGANLTKADTEVLQILGKVELGQPQATAKSVLAWLAKPE